MKWFLLVLLLVGSVGPCRAIDPETTRIAAALLYVAQMDDSRTGGSAYAAFQKLREVDPDEADSVASFWYYKFRISHFSMLEVLEDRARHQHDDDPQRDETLKTLWMALPAFMYEKHDEIRLILEKKTAYALSNPKVIESRKRERARREEWLNDFKK
jgi:hypothetical protein